MQNDIINKPITLQLNSGWVAINMTSPAVALTDLCKGTAKALNIDYVRDENGEYDFSQPEYAVPVSWDEWIELPIREIDFVVHTPKKTIRVPQVVICIQYNKVPVFMPKLNRKSLYERDRGICQYSGKKLNYKESSIDHVKPRSRGGDNSWTNVVLADKKLNTEKGNRLNREAGLKLLKNPVEPKPMTPLARFSQRENYPADWRMFLKV